MSNTYAGTSNQARTIEKDMGMTDFRGSFSSRAEPQSAVATDLGNLDNFALKSEMMEGFEERLTKVVYLGFLDADSCVKKALFCFSDVKVRTLDPVRSTCERVG